MSIRVRKLSVAALALVVCLSLSPVASAAVERDQDLDLREKIVRILKKAQKLLGGIASQTDSITPPKP